MKSNKQHQLEELELFASSMVSDVLEKAVNQLVFKQINGQGDPVVSDVACHRAGGDALLATGLCDSEDLCGKGLWPSSDQSKAGPGGELVKTVTDREYTVDKFDGPVRRNSIQVERVQDSIADLCCSHSVPSHIVPEKDLSKNKNILQGEGDESRPTSRVLEVHIPSNATSTDCPGIHVGNNQTSSLLPQVSRSYKSAGDVYHRCNQGVSCSSSSPSSQLIQFPLKGAFTKGPKRNQVSADKQRILMSQRQKLPPRVARMSAVLVSTRARIEKQRLISSYYEEKGCRKKILSLDQCINSRPPMPFDLDNPGPCRYTPPRKPPNETNSPEYTFGYKFYERVGGGRTAWSKAWFNSHDNQTTKVNFEDRWPSPANHSGSRSLIGRKLPSKPTYPSYTIGSRTMLSINKRGSEKEPSPNEYNLCKADKIIYHKAPSFSMAFRHKGTSLWSSSEITPSPDIYTPRLACTSSRTHRPAFTIQGIRRPKSHALGPYATL